MVAITVVLGAVAFVLVDSLSDQEDTPPLPAFSKKGGVLTVERADQGLDWFDDFTRGGSCTPLLNGVAWPSASGTPITAGDRISGCQPGEDFTLAHTATGTLTYRTTF